MFLGLCDGNSQDLLTPKPEDCALLLRIQELWMQHFEYYFAPPDFHSQEMDAMETQTNLSATESHSRMELIATTGTIAPWNLSQRLLKAQDEERRRLARDLHDSTGQTLTALKISVTLLQRKQKRDASLCQELCAIERLADQALQEIRTMSFLLHPPLLDEVGFTIAARCYIEGLAQRSGIRMWMQLAPEIERLPSAIEIALFRVLQESLTNVHRHSGASQVDIRFFREAGSVVLEVRDYGRGMPPRTSRAGS
jgi:signal transduction histidine kinase